MRKNANRFPRLLKRNYERGVNFEEKGHRERAGTKPLLQTERANTHVSALSVSEVFANAKVKLCYAQ